MSDSDSDSPPRTLDVATVGSAVVDRLYSLTNLPEPDGGAFARAESTAVGGVAANVAAALAELGRETGVVARLGGGEDGERVLADLRERGIDAARVRRGDERTSYAMVFRDPEGERMIVAGGESVLNLRIDADDLAYLREADAVFTSAYAPDPAGRALADAASENADLPPLVFDLAGPLEELEDRGARPETVDDLVAASDLVVSSEVPIRSYLGVGPREALRELRARGVDRAAVTLGADGALLLADGEILDVPAFEVDAVDTTGAGDAFTAGLLDAWLLGGKSPEEAGRFAAATAALNCTGEGARGGLPSRAAVRNLLD
ncbi:MULTISPECIES: carbohydrate kinase family protein [Halorussus]|uniref:carbohydrate kinase family protein n=1 Tax=Halorussus TaxID=1070314 RepID=UPI00209D44A0|nr:carbohydrate kinase family protein [Halorussus vallis]USZ74528.1 carbohydrate kinase family protein [Halorussus vallis]